MSIEYLRSIQKWRCVCVLLCTEGYHDGFVFCLIRSNWFEESSKVNIFNHLFIVCSLRYVRNSKLFLTIFSNCFKMSFFLLFEHSIPSDWFAKFENFSQIFSNPEVYQHRFHCFPEHSFDSIKSYNDVVAITIQWNLILEKIWAKTVKKL